MSDNVNVFPAYLLTSVVQTKTKQFDNYDGGDSYGWLWLVNQKGQNYEIKCDRSGKLYGLSKCYSFVSIVSVFGTFRKS